MTNFVEDGRPSNLVQVGVGQDIMVQLAIDASYSLDVVSSDPSVFVVSEITGTPLLRDRAFTVHGLRQGSARLYAMLRSGTIIADARVIVGETTLYRYYHGTSSDIADIILADDLSPRLIEMLRPRAVAFDWTDYTDFGKGFYVHLWANRHMAFEWAKRRFANDWAVVEFIATPRELRGLWSTALHFNDKSDRPHNAPEPVTVTTSVHSIEFCPIPQILPCVRATRRETTVTRSGTKMSWIEFVEFNRHIDRHRALIARPNDRDWSRKYSRIRGPIWVPRDSGYPVGSPKFHDRIHQLNWGRAGMNVLNRPYLKARRFKFSADNESLFPPPRKP